jgi:lipoprotein signal peptidase
LVADAALLLGLVVVDQITKAWVIFSTFNLADVAIVVGFVAAAAGALVGGDRRA